MKKINIYLVLVLVCAGMVMFNSCEKETTENVQQVKTDFDSFSVSVENNTLVFETQEDLQECINYLVEIGEENYDEFEKQLGYHSFRSTGKELIGFDDPIMKTLINPNFENVICGYLLVSDFEAETTFAYKLLDADICELDQVIKNELDMVQLSFDDDFFEYIEKGVLLKSTSDYCIADIDTDNVDDYKVGGADDQKITVRTKVEYRRSTFYKYLHIYFWVRAYGGVPSFKANYATLMNGNNSLCYFSTNAGTNNSFERSESISDWIYPNNSIKEIVFDRKPFNSISRLEDYYLEVDYYVDVTGSQYPGGVFTKQFNTKIECIKE